MPFMKQIIKIKYMKIINSWIILRNADLHIIHETENNQFYLTYNEPNTEDESTFFTLTHISKEEATDLINKTPQS